MPRFSLLLFSLSYSLFLLLYRDIEADRSTLKPHFTPSNYTPKWHRAFPFFVSFRVSLVPFSLSLSLPFSRPWHVSPSYSRYIFARFLHSSSFEPSEKGFVREPFIFSRVSRPDASGPTPRCYDSDLFINSVKRTS